MEDILVPIFVCVVLPVSIVLIVFLAAMNSENKRAQILIKALEVNNSIDAEKLAETLRKQKKTEREILNLRLLRGCIFSLIGILLIIIACIVNLVQGGGFNEDATGLMISGGISSAIGVSYLIVYFVTRKQLSGDKSEQ